MADSGTYRGLPVDLVQEMSDRSIHLAVENGARNASKPTTLIGDSPGQLLVEPTQGNRLVIKAITIIGDGNQGTIKVKRELGDVTILPAYFSAQNRAGTSGALNIVLEVDESVYVTAIGRGTSETFIGVSYLELFP